MKIGILGTGPVGGSLGRAWAKAGHTIIYGTRDMSSEKVQALLADTGHDAQADSHQATVAACDVAVVAMRWPAAGEVLASVTNWDGKPLIDLTNRFGGDSPNSAAEDAARLAPGAQVVKAFNTIGQEHYDHPSFGGMAPSLFICGDDAAAKGIVGQLAADLGFDVVDVGALSQAGLVESLAKLWVALTKTDLGRDIGFRLLR